MQVFFHYHYTSIKRCVVSINIHCPELKSHGLCRKLNAQTKHVIFFLHFCPTRPYVELVNFLLTCGDKVRSWVSRRLRGQCEQHWGALCSSFSSTCSRSQSDAPQHTTTPPRTLLLPSPVGAQEPLQQPTSVDEPDERNGENRIDNVTESGLPMFEKANVTAS